MVRRFQIPLQTILAIAVIIVSAWLLFFRLDHYALWDDEAYTALGAKGVLRTGDTTAVIDHNIIGYRAGDLLHNLHDRSRPPLPEYLTAPFLKLFGEDNARAARLPFAISGLAAIALIMWWMRRDGVSLLVQAVVALGLVCNASLLLYCRQARYYSMAIFLSVAIAFLYLHVEGRRWKLFLMSVLSFALLATHYISYAALYACLVVDFLVWRRKEKALPLGDAAVLFLPQLVLGAALVLLWNPFQTRSGGYGSDNTFLDRLLLLVRNFRDMNEAEFMVAPLLLLVPVIGYLRGQRWLLRGSAAFVTYVAAVSALSPQPIKATFFADIRYLAPLIPLAIAMEAQVICTLAGFRTWVATAIAAIAFATNFIHGGPLLQRGFRSTIVEYVQELIELPGDPYSAAARWINENVGRRESVWVIPDYMTYPLMFHAPEPVYAWQFKWPAEPQFQGLSLIHFQGQVPPDYVIVFGPQAYQVAEVLRNWDRADAEYEHIATLGHFWKDLHRPELFWRTFKPVTDYDRNREAIYIFRNRW